MEGPELAMVMPVYNEEGAIEKVIRKWSSELERLDVGFQIHAYNDGSKDDTLSILNRLSRENRHLSVHDKPNSGHGPTLVEAYRQNGDARWIFQIDSDDEMGPGSFSAFWEQRDEFDFLVGRRMRGQKQPLSRAIVSFISRLLVHWIYGKKVYDVNSPYRLIRTDAFKDVFKSLPDDMFAPNVVISGMASCNNLRVLEMPVQQRNRVQGEVSIQRWKLLKAAMKSFYQTIVYRLKRPSCMKESGWRVKGI